MGDGGKRGRDGKGQVVPEAVRPTKSPTLYARKEIADATGRVSPHLGVQSFMPIDGKGGEDLAGPYEPVADWPKQIEPGWRLSGPSGCYAASADKVIVVSHFGMVRDLLTDLKWGRNVFSIDASPFRTYGTLEMKPTNHVVTFDREGNMVDSWTWQDQRFGKINRIFVDPHDPQGHVWITDSKKQKVFKFTPDGREIVMQIGEVEAGSRPNDPWKAEDISWLPNGDFYVAGLGRIDRFTRDGKHMWSKLARGSEPGEFFDLHGLCIDHARHRIYLADRGNSRIQVFDEDWRFLDLWPNILAPYAMRLAKNGDIWVADGFTSKFLRYDLDGKLITSWGQWGIAPGTAWGIHWFDTDPDGNLYVCEVYAERVQKYRPRRDVSPKDPRLIGELHRY